MRRDVYASQRPLFGHPVTHIKFIILTYILNNVKLRCGRCGYEWLYRGKSEWYTSCPRCKTSVRVGRVAPDLDAAVKSLRREMPELASRYGVKRLALFGSFVRGEQSGASDVDIVVELERPLGFEFVDLAERLERALGRRVDLLTPAGLRSIRVASVRERIEGSLVYV